MSIKVKGAPECAKITVKASTNQTESVFVQSQTQGKSAYQIAIDNGFIGTEEEWLKSLQSTITSQTITDALGYTPVDPSSLKPIATSGDAGDVSYNDTTVEYMLRSITESDDNVYQIIYDGGDASTQDF